MKVGSAPREVMVCGWVGCSVGWEEAAGLQADAAALLLLD